MTLEAHHLNVQKTYRYSLTWISGGFFLLCPISLFFSIQQHEAILAAILNSVLAILVAVQMIRYKVALSPLGISKRAWRKETFIAWQEIRIWYVTKYALRIYRAQDSYLEINFQSPGYDEIWQTLRANRPDLFQTRVIHRFQGEDFIWLFGMSVLSIFFVLIELITNSKHLTEMTFSIVFFLLLGLGGSVISLTSKRWIELGTSDLVITYPLGKKHIPLTDIVEIRQGAGVQTRSGKLVRLGKVKEGQTALYEYLLNWWRADQPPA